MTETTEASEWEQTALREVAAMAERERDELLALLPLVRTGFISLERDGRVITVSPVPYRHVPLLELLRDLRRLAPVPSDGEDAGR